MGTCALRTAVTLVSVVALAINAVIVVAVIELAVVQGLLFAPTQAEAYVVGCGGFPTDKTRARVEVRERQDERLLSRLNRSVACRRVRWRQGT